MTSGAHLPEGVYSVGDYEQLARQTLDGGTWAYVAGGAADELTLAANRAAFDALRLNGRVLADMNRASTELTVLGERLPYPILLAPVSRLKLVHPDGERAVVQGASAMGAGVVVSTEASVPLEDLAREAASPLWFQLYVQHDRGFTRELVQRAEHAGYRGLVVTVDAPVGGVRNREQRAGFRVPEGVEAVNLRGLPRAPFDAPGFLDSPLFSGLMSYAATWTDIAALRRATRLPILLKGIMTPEDAGRAMTEGVSGIVVSNHGGRTLDTLPATIDVLPAIAARVDGRVPILLDGGVRRGTDVLKAIALGASAVMVGRPYVCGLAAAGAIGVAHVLAILRAELEVAMALTGCATLSQATPSVIWSR